MMQSDDEAQPFGECCAEVLKDGRAVGSAAHSLLSHSSSFFREIPGQRFYPRSVLADTEPTTLDTIRSGSLASFFHPRSFVAGLRGCGGSWSAGALGEGSNIVDHVLAV